MVKYRNTGSELLYTAQTTGGATVDIPNNGVTRITSTAAERYVMAPPVAGCRKTILFSVSTSSLDRVIELSSVSSGDSITILHGTGDATGTEIVCQGTNSYCLELLGISTAQWQLLSAQVAAAPSTAIQFPAS